MNSPAEFDDQMDHFVGILAYTQDLSIGKGDNRIRGFLNVLNQVRVNDEWYVIEPR
jgi:hypothetical protein